MNDRAEEIEAAFAALDRPRQRNAEAVFRARVEARLKGLEDDLSEVKTRLNGLLFFLGGTVIAQAAAKTSFLPGSNCSSLRPIWTGMLSRSRRRRLFGRKR
jgi:hypothetical protein